VRCADCRLKPKVIVIADSEYPANRRANRSLKERLAQTKIPVIYTRDSGAVKIVTDKSGWKLETMDGQKFSSVVSSMQLKRAAPAE
jgi:beta-lactamase superfamily II metal-dependent hydrolase